MKQLLLFITLNFCLAGFCVSAQENLLSGWHLKDKAKDGCYGLSLDQAYRFLAEKKINGKPVIVAVLDSGIDTAHEDLAPVLWINPGEIAGNKKDDDGNGFADDVHGWSFLANPDGRNVIDAGSEWIRVYWRYKAKYDGRVIHADSLSPEQQYEYALWQKARGGVVNQGMSAAELANLDRFMTNMLFCDSVFKIRFAANEYTQANLVTYKPQDQLERDMKAFVTEVFKQAHDPQIRNTLLLDQLKTYVLGEKSRAMGDKIPPEDIHLIITGNDEKDMLTTRYGSADIQAAKPDHGTHVSGIIAAVRNNGIGMDGIAGNVQIMMVRTVPEGDEYDKDIALGIRYAVDNGAKIISMSFGKSLSPNKKFIDDAVRYAAGKDVLLVQGAGNSKRNIDAYDNFPNPRYLHGDSLAPNWITVGASDAKGMAADFSNYGIKAVDVFAPGVAIYSTFPNNKYIFLDGTSMATPVVSGLAALIRSYFPALTAREVKKIIEQSVVMPAEETLKPGSKEKVLMSALCKSGGIVNAFNAVKLAAGYKK